jgi:hypothetical protein
LFLEAADGRPIGIFLPNMPLVVAALMPELDGRGLTEEKVDVLVERGAEIFGIDVVVSLLPS